MLLLAIDAAVKNVGIMGARIEKPGGPLESIAFMTTPLVRFGIMAKTLKEQWPGEKLHVIIERSASTIPRFRVARAAARACEDEIKRVWKAKERKIYVVTPSEWQNAVLKGIQIEDPKLKALYMARDVLGYHVADHHQADAACLMHYLTTTLLREGT